MNPVVCAIDVGTTAVKGACFDQEGASVASAYVEHDVLRNGATVEQRPAALEDAICRVAGELVRGHRLKVSAVAITGARATFVPIDATGAPLMNFIVWQDSRAAEFVDLLARTLGETRYYEVTGLTLSPVATLTKAMWLKAHEPDVHARTERLASQPEYFLRWLGAEAPALDPSAAAYFGALDLRSQDWSSEILEAADLEEETLPSVAPAGAVVGVTSHRGAEATGLPAGVPLVVAPSDWSACMVGAGALTPGAVTAYLGTAGSVGCVLQSPLLDPDRRLTCLPHVGETWELEGLLLTAGGPYKWFRDMIANEDYEAIEQRVAMVPAGARGLIALPTFTGAGAPSWDPKARGGFLGLRLDHTEADVARAILEGVSFELKSALDALQAVGPDVTRVTVAGGASQSHVWMQIQSDVFGLPVETLGDLDPTLGGTAVAAGVALGWFADFAEGSDALVHDRRVFTPNPAHELTYDEAFHVYRDIHDVLRSSGLNRRIARMTPGRRLSEEE